MAGRGQAADGRGKGAGGGVLVGPGEEAVKKGVSGLDGCMGVDREGEWEWDEMSG